MSVHLVRNADRGASGNGMLGIARNVSGLCNDEIAVMFNDVDPLTIAKIDVLRVRDGVSPAQFLALATEAYALMLPGWPYPADDRGTC